MHAYNLLFIFIVIISCLHFVFLQSFKFAYAQRSHLGDPFDQSVRDEVEQLIINMTRSHHHHFPIDPQDTECSHFLCLCSPAVADELRSLITPNETHDPSYYGHAFDLEEIPGTTHVSVYGPDGDAVAVTRYCIMSVPQVCSSACLFVCQFVCLSVSVIWFVV